MSKRKQVKRDDRHRHLPIIMLHCKKFRFYKKICSSTTEVLDFPTKYIVPRFLRRLLQWKNVIIAKETRQWRLDRLLLEKSNFLHNYSPRNLERDGMKLHITTGCRHSHVTFSFYSCKVLDSETLST